MNNLKTLKDLPRCDANSLCRYENIHVDVIKAEAVKRWKFYEDLIQIEALVHVRGEFNSKISAWKGAQKEIIEFNSLTEADLKEGVGNE